MKIIMLAMFFATQISPSMAAPLSGKILLDGSSTVFPISEAVAEEYGEIEKSVRVTVGTSGTGGGFKKFCAGEIDINDASRKINPAEALACKGKNIEYIELAIAQDAVTIVVHPSSSFTSKITLTELKKIWEPGSQIKKWSDVNPAWPSEKIYLYGPGPDSGTFDFFTEAVVGKAKASRADFTASEDDNVLLKGVSATRNSLGYFGIGYYVANKTKVKALAVDGGKGAVEPSDATIESGAYILSRPLYIYVSSASAVKPQVKSFVNFYLNNAKNLSREAGFKPLKDNLYQAALGNFAKVAK